MVLWALVVICSLVTAIPVVGDSLLGLFQCGSVVSGVTVNRCFGLPFILPLVLMGLVVGNWLVLHWLSVTGEVGMVLRRHLAIAVVFRCVYVSLV